ncbi:hypothetical protein PSCICL_15700 [Pseudomonas cichorii]|nr:hypothetical protein PSCICL_15700 [Pseudomonas cichorii]
MTVTGASPVPVAWVRSLLDFLATDVPTALIDKWEARCNKAFPGWRAFYERIQDRANHSPNKVSLG